MKYANIQFIINGGIDSIDKAKKLLLGFDGVMVGRLIQNNPFELKNIDQIIFDSNDKVIINEDVIVDYFEYIKPIVNKDSIFRLLSPLIQIFLESRIVKILKSQFMKKW